MGNAIGIEGKGRNHIYILNISVGDVFVCGWYTPLRFSDFHRKRKQDPQNNNLERQASKLVFFF